MLRLGAACCHEGAMYTRRMFTRLGQQARIFTCYMLLATLTLPAFCWGSYGHKLIDQVAARSLPLDVPAFLRSGAAVDALGYYGPEPDRWGSSSEPELKIAQEPDHFLSMEWSDLIGPLPRNRNEYVRALAAAQPAHPELKLTAEEVGTQPYETNELWQRLKSAFRNYRRLKAANEDTRPVEAEIVFLAGWMGHYVADGSQPLHTSFMYNGWIGANPNGYTSEHHIHSQFESRFATNVSEADVTHLVPQRPATIGDIFTGYVAYLRHSHTLFEQVYRFEKAGELNGTGTPASRAFTAERMAAGATELRDLIYAAWLRSADPLSVRHD